MRFDAQQALVQLPAHRTLHLTDARGTHLRAVSGTSWITIDHDPQDHVLEPGDEWIVDSSRPVLVMALGGSATLDVSAPLPH